MGISRYVDGLAVYFFRDFDRASSDSAERGVGGRRFSNCYRRLVSDGHPSRLESATPDVPRIRHVINSSANCHGHWKRDGNSNRAGIGSQSPGSTDDTLHITNSRINLTLSFMVVGLALGWQAVLLVGGIWHLIKSLASQWIDDKGIG